MVNGPTAESFSSNVRRRRVRFPPVTFDYFFRCSSQTVWDARHDNTRSQYTPAESSTRNTRQQQQQQMNSGNRVVFPPAFLLPISARTDGNASTTAVWKITKQTHQTYSLTHVSRVKKFFRFVWRPSFYRQTFSYQVYSAPMRNAVATAEKFAYPPCSFGRRPRSRRVARTNAVTNQRQPNWTFYINVNVYCTLIARICTCLRICCARVTFSIRVFYLPSLRSNIVL